MICKIGKEEMDAKMVDEMESTSLSTLYYSHNETMDRMVMYCCEQWKSILSLMDL